jgi:hypothetical protein
MTTATFNLLATGLLRHSLKQILSILYHFLYESPGC